MTVNTMDGMTPLRDCGKDVYCRRFFAMYFSRQSDTFRSAKLQRGPTFFEDLVHLEEDFGEGGLEVETLAHVRRPVRGLLFAGDAGVVCKSTENLARITVIVTVFEAAGLTVCETKKETTPPRTLNKVLPHRLLSKRRARGMYADDAYSVPARRLINESADITP